MARWILHEESPHFFNEFVKIGEYDTEDLAIAAMYKAYDNKPGDYMIKEDGYRGMIYRDYRLHLDICPNCQKTVRRRELMQTYDCCGIPFRWVCPSCYERIMYSKKGYDGEYYDELDECVNLDW